MDIKKALKEERKKKTKEVKDSLKDIVECSEKLTAMRGSPGWKYVEDYLTEKMESGMNALLTSKEDRDIYYNQAVVTVIRELLEKIGVSFLHATNAREMLKKYK